MATLQVFNQGRYDSLTNQMSGLQNTLDASPTAYTDNTDPTMGDVSVQSKLDTTRTALDKEKALQIHESWYGPGQNETTQPGTDEGLLSHGLRVLGTPLNAVVGSASWALGKGVNNDLGQSVKGAIDSQKDFGSLLRQYNAPGYVTAPLGFALDVAFDPVNWATAGTSALIPRVGEGLIKGGVEGAREGFISRAGSMGTKLLSAVTPEAKEGRWVTPLNTWANSRIGRPLVDKLGTKAINATDAYDSIVRGAGNDITNDLGKGIIPGLRLTDTEHPATLSNYLTQAITDYIPNGEKIVNAFRMSNIDWMRRAKMKNQVLSLLSKRLAKLDEFGNPIPGTMDFDRIPAGEIPEEFQNVPDAPSATQQLFRQIATDALDTHSDDGSLTRTMNSAEHADRMLNERINQEKFQAAIQQVMQETNYEKTGIKWYDNTIQWIKNGGIGEKLGMDIPKTGNAQIDQQLGKIQNVEYAKNMLNGYQNFLAAFKTAKVGLSPTAWTNAILGNPVMAHLAGIDVTRADYFRSINNARKYFMGKSDAEYVNQVFNNKANGFLQFMDEHPDIVAGTVGVRPGDPVASLQKIAMQKQVLREAGIITNDMSDAEQAAQIKTTGEQFREWMAKVKSVQSELTPTQMKERLLEEAKKTGLSITPDMMETTGYVGNEVQPGEWLAKMKSRVAEDAKNPKNYGARLADKLLNDSMAGYERIDQSYKLGLTDHVMNNGISENELRLISRIVPLSPSDITSKYAATNRGEYLYRLSGEKAIEVANEVYMNYAAMPGAIKVLRSMPLVGGPFASYAYAMGSKIGKALVNNPSSFNKLNNLMNEMQGQKSPIEKEELKGKYYQYLNKPGVVRLSDIGGSQFLHDNPIYLDLTNMIPYYNMNSLTPTSRKYTGTFNDKMLSLLDQSPILKDPVGSTIFDYFILPLMLTNGEIPQNSFGSPIYPLNATGVQKAGYATRSLAETMVPGVAAYGGLAQGALAPGLTPYMPSSRWRTLAYATQNEDKLGAPEASQKKLELLLKGLGGSVGINAQNMNMNLNAGQLKQLINQNNAQAPQQ